MRIVNSFASQFAFPPSIPLLFSHLSSELQTTTIRIRGSSSTLALLIGSPSSELRLATNRIRGLGFSLALFIGSPSSELRMATSHIHGSGSTLALFFGSPNSERLHFAFADFTHARPFRNLDLRTMRSSLDLLLLCLETMSTVRSWAWSSS